MALSLLRSVSLAVAACALAQNLLCLLQPSALSGTVSAADAIVRPAGRSPIVNNAKRRQQMSAADSVVIATSSARRSHVDGGDEMVFGGMPTATAMTSPLLGEAVPRKAADAHDAGTATADEMIGCETLREMHGSIIRMLDTHHEYGKGIHALHGMIKSLENDLATVR